MKKIVFGCLLAIGMTVSLCAQDPSNVTFNEYVKLTKEAPSNPKGMTVCADETYRIIYVSLPLPIDSSKVTSELKKQMETQMKLSMRNNPEDLKIIKRLGISVVYTFITNDKKLILVGFAPSDF